MILQGVLFVFLFGVLDVGICAPAKSEKIDPVDLNYFCYSIKVSGKEPRKSPILLLHGLTSSLTDWNNFYEKFAVDTGRKVCGVDLRNHGDSPWNNRSDVEAYAVDIEHFLKERNIPKVNLIGHSLGGKIAVHFALKHPEQVDSLVVEDMRPNGVSEKSGGMMKAGWVMFEEALNAVPENSSEDEAKEAIAQFLTKTLTDLGEGIEGNIKDSLKLRFHEGKWTYKMNFNVLKNLNLEEYLTPSSGLYNGPALFIYGTESPFDVGSDESNIRKLFPQAKLVPVKGAGHIIHGVYQQYMDEVVEFINKI